MLVGLLIGCSARQQLGISELEWASYSKERKDFLIRRYKAIAEERLVVNVRQGERDNAGLIVEISDGKALFPPDFVIWRNYRPLSFTMAVNQCRELPIISEASSDMTTKLGVCLLGDMFYLDSSNYEDSKKFGSIVIHRSPLWKTGFNYDAIYSTGYVRLSDTTIKIKLNNPACQN